MILLMMIMMMMIRGDSERVHSVRAATVPSPVPRSDCRYGLKRGRVARDGGKVENISDS